MHLRHAEPRDHDALYHISVVTGAAGGDASPLHDDPTLIGAIYSVPYAVLLPDWTWVAEDDSGVAGFVVGAPDTRAFEARIDAEWFAPLRRRFPDPAPVPAEQRTADQREQYLIHHPQRVPDAVAGPYPAHMHMNLLPRAQGAGLGRRLFDRWTDRARAAGTRAVHIGAARANAGGIAFWKRVGFRPIPDAPADGAVWLGQRL